MKCEANVKEFEEREKNLLSLGHDSLGSLGFG
jgi:hypothetical protein